MIVMNLLMILLMTEVISEAQIDSSNDLRRSKRVDTLKCKYSYTVILR